MIGSFKIMFLIVLLVLVNLLTGCQPNSGEQGEKQQTSQEIVKTLPVAGQDNAAKTQRIVVYRATKDARYLVPEVHEVPQNDHPVKTALELLLTDSHNPDTIFLLPPGTKLRGVSVKNGVAYVDFNEKLIKGSNEGSTGEMLMVAAIVNTLTEFSEIDKVQIMVEGKKVDTLAGHMDVSEPLSRSEKIIKKSL
ncbi:MAG: Lipoprotein LpqB, GerMN protein [Firmicutes bacterium]|nr:Lipoprotein LpqB, GerMN protein [Bacillota bacterium]